MRTGILTAIQFKQFVTRLFGSIQIDYPKQLAKLCCSLI